MSDCDCEKLKQHAAILTEILEMRSCIDKEQTTVRIGMLMRMIGSELKTADPVKKKHLRKELIQASAACLRFLEDL